MTGTRPVKVGNVIKGGGGPVVIQSMTKTRTENIEATLEQIRDLHRAGCELVRVAVPHKKAVRALPAIVQVSPIPVVADIHFDYRLALSSLEAGVHGLRINPGNIGTHERVRAVINAAGERGVPIRIGVNSGSLPQEKVQENGGPNAKAMVATVLEYIEFFEQNDFFNIVISMKSTSVLETVKANRVLSKQVDYPLHIGLTEAGSGQRGIIRSIAALSPLLLEGIGDTIRISLTGDPVTEVETAWELLKSLQMRERGVTVYSCPTCGRCQIGLEELVSRVESETRRIKTPVLVAIMGCAVNGPGEAKEADVGIAGGKDFGFLFVKGRVVGKYPYEELAPRLLEAIEKFALDKEES